MAGDMSMADPVFEPDGGDPGGYISNEDEPVGETWYFRAPDDVLAHLAEAEGGLLSFSLKQSADEPGFLDDDIIIQGPAGRLSYRFRRTPGTEWTTYTVRLSASEGWRWNWNAPATDAQVRSVLRDPSSLDIRGEYYTGPDVGGLDTFVLTAAE